MKSILTALLVVLASTCYASQRAVTDTGDQVILNDDGTWHYVNKASAAKSAIGTNLNRFVKPHDATFLLKSAKNHSAFWIDAHKWTFEKATSNPSAEYEFQLKHGDLYALAIDERIAAPEKTLVDAAIENARHAASDTRVIKREYRTVNGRRVIFMHMRGTMHGIVFDYLGYYRSGPSGSTQLVVFTTPNLVKRYRPAIFDFLNGLTTQ